MRLVMIESCSPGMKLGKSILNDEGRVLLSRGYELTSAMIIRLRKMGVQQIYIDDPRTEDIRTEETLGADTRRTVYAALHECIDHVQSNGLHSSARGTTFSRLIDDSVSAILEDVMRNPHLPIVHVRSVATTQDSPEHHYCNNALNVAVFASKLALSDGCRIDDLRIVCSAALLHDVGKLLVPRQLLMKRGTLTEAELRELRRHTELGYRLIREDGSVSPVVAQCALQHHERVDGKGYPFGLKGEDIHPFAKLIGMLDAYDALISPRAYRNAMLPHDALDYLYANAESAYDRDKVELFRNKVAIFPPGTAVTLSTGERGIVSHLDSSCLQRPTIRVLTDPIGRELNTPYELQLSKQLHIMIRSVGDPQSDAG